MIYELCEKEINNNQEVYDNCNIKSDYASLILQEDINEKEN